MNLRRLLLRAFSALIVLSILLTACNLPGFTPRPTPGPTPLDIPPLPPALVETYPLAGSSIALHPSITLYFNQPMEPDSVEAAISFLPEVTGEFTWTGDSTLTFTPSQPLQPDSALALTIGMTAAARNGLTFEQPAALAFRTADYLRLAQSLPETGLTDVSAASAVVAAFNQPVVALGADPASLPPAFTLQPAATGQGKWLNTSTYIFHPDPAFSGGVTYTAALEPSLRSTLGSPLAPDTNQSWEFTAAPPRLVSITPETELPLPLDEPIRLTFNTPMDAGSVVAAFSFTGPDDQPVPGSLSWNKQGDALTFTPDDPLERDRDYLLTLADSARARGGSRLEQETVALYRTYPDFGIYYTTPASGAYKDDYTSIEIHFSSPLPEEGWQSGITVTPAVSGLSVYGDSTSAYLYAYFEPSTRYTVNVAAGLEDRWGQTLGETYTFDVLTRAAAPSLSIPYMGGNLLFVRSGDPLVMAQATNIASLDIVLAPLPLAEMMELNSPGSYQEFAHYVPPEALEWTQAVSIPKDDSEVIAIDLSPRTGLLAPGVYFFTPGGWNNVETSWRDQYFIVSSHLNLVFKIGATDAFIWAVDLRDDQPVAGASVTIYDEMGTALASGQTDSQGIWHGQVAAQDEYVNYYAVLGEPGDDLFGLASTEWNREIAPWDFSISYQNQPPQPVVYFYTDRPIYRPGQVVYYRAVVRQAFDARYGDAGLGTIAFHIADGYGQAWDFDLPLSAYGTASGSFELPADAQPGYYSIGGSDPEFYSYFTVADYRKPEIELGVSLTPQDVAAGGEVQAEVEARYYFDAPASDVPVDWTFYRCVDSFRLAGYRVGLYDSGWMNLYYDFDHYGCSAIDSGQGLTGADGMLSLTFSDLPVIEDTERLALEVTLQDESGYPVSAHAEATRHPADYYIGLRPDLWLGQAGSALGFEALTVDWAGDPSPERALQADFLQVEWQRQLSDEYPWPVYFFVPVYTPVASSDIVTGADGVARLSFTPEMPGVYMLDVQGEGVRSQVMLWVGGAHQAAWPDLLSGHIELTPDQEQYQPGDTAQVFIPNPLGTGAQALVTLERGTVREWQVIQLNASGATFPVSLTAEEAPNVYLTATLLRDGEFRLGYANLAVDPAAMELNVELTGTPQRTEPGGQVAFDLRVTDQQNRPVQGEFSLSVVDLAALALAGPNSPGIMDFFYDQQPLGVWTSLALAGETRRALQEPAGGKGGGGDGMLTVIREDFPDTAYWNATIVTDADGRASVSLALPDNLTTWQVEVRGLTHDTRVGQAQMQVVTSKDLLVRPVTPRFMVTGDHLELGAIVQNNTSRALDVDVSIQTENFSLDDPDRSAFQVEVPANGRVLVAWWGTALDGDTADFVFSARAGSLADATHPVTGAIPVLHYTAPQTYSSAGIVAEAGTELEAISLPRSFDPGGGELTLELSPSLAAAILGSLESAGIPPATCSNDTLLSYILTHVELYLSLNAAGLEAPAVEEQMGGNIQAAVRTLARRQRDDGGWGWWGGDIDPYTWQRSGSDSNPYLSAYILFGLQRARLAGIEVDEEVFVDGRAYLAATRPYLGGGSSIADWELDSLAFQAYVLEQTGGAEKSILTYLYGKRDRMQPWSLALLALTLESRSSGDPQAEELRSNLQTTAIRSASGAHWESEVEDWYLPGSPLYTTAMVVYVLSQDDPAAPLLADAVRYLAAQRGGGRRWVSSYETAWVILALNAYMTGAGSYAASFPFQAHLNGLPFAEGQAAGPTALTPVTAVAPVASLLADAPNALSITRGEGSGSLYYRADLRVYRPVEQAGAYNGGIAVERAYTLAGCGDDCESIHSVQVDGETRLTVRLTLTLEHTAYFLNLVDTIPAGTEILDTILETSQQYGDLDPEVSLYDPENPFSSGWGWWYFDSPRIFDDRILWTAEYLPAGTYALTYTLIPLHAGEYRVIPARAWLEFFPEVQGTSAGEVFTITR